MLVPSNSINVFDDSRANSSNWFNGRMNTHHLDFDPLVTGYAFIFWLHVPNWVTAKYPGFKNFTQKNFKAFEGLSDIELQTNQYIHTFNGNQYEVANTIQKANTNFSLQHQEFSGNPVKNMYQYWVSGIRDPETDIAPYAAMAGVDYMAKNHTGELLYVVTRPDANNFGKRIVEFSCYYTAVMPLNIPLQHYNYAQGTHDSPTIDIRFVGDMHIGKEVDDLAATTIMNHYGFRTADSIFGAYQEVVGGGPEFPEYARADGNIPNSEPGQINQGEQNTFYAAQDTFDTKVYDQEVDYASYVGS